MIDGRDALIEAVNPLLADLITKAKGGRIRDEKKAKIRISYCNALSNLIRAYSTLLRDKELEQIQEELMELKNEFEQSQERY